MYCIYQLDTHIYIILYIYTVYLAAAGGRLQLEGCWATIGAVATAAACVGVLHLGHAYANPGMSPKSPTSPSA